MSEPPLAVALLTPLAPGGIAVLQLAGPGTFDVLSRCCRKDTSIQAPGWTPGDLVHCRLFDGDELLDEVVVAVPERQSPPCAEICLHGGVRVVQRAILLMQRLGARRTDPPAFLDPEPVAESNGEWVQPNHAAPAIASRIDALWSRATTRRWARWLLRQRILLPRFADRLSGRTAPAVSAQERDAFIARTAAVERLLRGIRVAIVGPPNAGKSTLANALIGRDRIITSPQPGTTRDWVDETIMIDGWPATLTDTAGIRRTDDVLESLSIERGLHAARTADLVLAVFDAIELQHRPHVMQSFCAELALGTQNALIVQNKCDLLASGEPDSRQANITDDRLCVSALTRAGLDALEASMAQSLGLHLLQDDQPAPVVPIDFLLAMHE